MNDDSPPLAENEAPSPSTSPVATPAIRRPWVTASACLICMAIFVALLVTDEDDQIKKLRMVGYRDGNEVWNGSIWALITCVFIHEDIVHFGLNLYWLWVFGPLMERQMGSGRFTLFFITAAFISSSMELAWSGTPGIGASGVVYAFFGYMWYTRQQIPDFQTAIDRKTCQLFFWWLPICVGLTVTGVLHVGNSAHFSGLFFGILIASASVVRDRPVLSSAGLVALSIFSITTLVWCPWSTVWLSAQAYNAHAAGDYQTAVYWYAKVIERDPGNDWARQNRQAAEQQLLEQGKPWKDQQP